MTRSPQPGRAYDEFGLPVPQEYDRPYFDALDYISADEYKEARSISEAIEMRGHDAFVEMVDPTDFGHSDLEGYEKLGYAELWAQSTWTEEFDERDVALERIAASVDTGDMIEARPCPQDQSEWGYAFYDVTGALLPFQPYHDYDDDFFSRLFSGAPSYDVIVCRVIKTTCYGGTAAPADPEFNWRVYVLSVVVY